MMLKEFNKKSKKIEKEGNAIDIIEDEKEGLE